MRGRERRRRVTPPVLLVAGLAASAVLVLGLWGAQRSRALTLERRTSQDTAVLADVAHVVALELELARDAVGDAARTATARTPGWLPRGPSTSGTGEPVLSGAERSDPDVSALLDRARDSGQAVLSRPVVLRGGPRIIAVAATYSSDAGARPKTTTERRTRLSGWVIDPLDPAEVLGARLPDGSAGTISDGHVTWAVGDTGPGLPEQSVEVSGLQLTVSAGNPSSVSVRASTVALTLVTVALAAAAALAVLAVGRRMRELREEATDRAEQVQLIVDVAPLVQQSLELADVLPAVAVQLSDHFGLAGVALSAGTGGQVQLFTMGEPPAAHAQPVLRPPEHVAAGETVSLALQRGARSVAVLHLVAGRELHASELQSVRALSELVTAAVVNAALYASQQEALRRFRELDVLKTVFLGTASHELRTPVTAIGGFASLLTGNWDRFDEAQRRDFVERIGANARTLNAVVQDLLDFSLLDKGTLAVSIEEIDLGALVESVVDRLDPTFSNHEVRFSSSPAPRVAGDVNGLERIVTNLLTNAVKFSPEGTTVSLVVGPAGDGYGAQLVVTDQGPGIPPEERAQIFTRFFRGSADRVNQTRGVGIGLSVVAEFVARLRGDVLVDDAPGGGARFTIRLPASSDQLLAKEAVHAPTT